MQFGLGQMIHNLSGDAFTDKPFFDRDFIERNRIKSLAGNYSRKKDGDIVRASNDFFKYEFDSIGNLISTFQVRSELGKKDTALNFYYYNKNGSLSIHRKTENGGLTANHYSYDSLNRIISIEQTRDIINSKGEVLHTISINKETMKYFQSENGFKKVTYNNYGLPYMDEYEKWDSVGYKLEEIQVMRMSSTQYTKKFFYNDKGFLASWSTTVNESNNPLEECQFKYDNFGNLIERKNYKDGFFLGELQIIYDNKTQLLGSTIEKMSGSNLMLILRFQVVEFFN